MELHVMGRKCIKTETLSRAVHKFIFWDYRHSPADSYDLFLLIPASWKDIIYTNRENVRQAGKP